MEEKRSEISRAEAYANEEVPRAKGQAAATRLGGEAYAIGRKARARGEATRFRQLETAHRRAANVVEIRLRLEALERALADRQKLILTGRSGARRQMWLLDSQGVTKVMGDGSQVTGDGTAGPEQAPPAPPPGTPPPQPQTETGPAGATTPEGQAPGTPKATQEGSQ